TVTPCFFSSSFLSDKSRSSRRAVTTRSAPAAASLRANASPSPLDAPVTSARLPFRSGIDMHAKLSCRETQRREHRADFRALPDARVERLERGQTGAAALLRPPPRRRNRGIPSGDLPRLEHLRRHLLRRLALPHPLAERAVATRGRRDVQIADARRAE